MQSIRSTALEPTAVELERLPLAHRIGRLIPVYGLLIGLVVLIVVFSITLPNTFPTLLNFRSILGDKAIIAILSLAAMNPLMAGRIDLTVGCGIVLWIVTEYLPIGRYLYAIGANPRAAELNGIRSRRFVIGAFMASGLLGAIAGVVLAARLRIGQASVGLEFLLPALVGAFLGSTTIKPGRVNVWGTIVGVAILAVGISGIQQLGGEFYVEPLFNGVTLLFAIGLAGYAQRRAKPVARHAPEAPEATE